MSKVTESFSTESRSSDLLDALMGVATGGLSEVTGLTHVSGGSTTTCTLTDKDSGRTVEGTGSSRDEARGDALRKW